jgi:hypothetical protein
VAGAHNHCENFFAADFLQMQQARRAALNERLC